MIDLDGPHRRRRHPSPTGLLWAAVMFIGLALVGVVFIAYQGM